MRTEQIEIVKNTAVDYPVCPICGRAPVVKVTLSPVTYDNSDRVEATNVRCPKCFLSAPEDIWYALCEGFKEEDQNEQ